MKAKPVEAKNTNFSYFKDIVIETTFIKFENWLLLHSKKTRVYFQKLFLGFHGQANQYFNVVYCERPG